MCSGARHPTDAGTPGRGRLPTQEEPSQVVSGDCHPGPTASLLSGVLPPLSCLLSLGFLSRALQGSPVQEQPSSAPLLQSQEKTGPGHTPCSPAQTRANDGEFGGELSRLDLFSGLGTSSSPSSETMVTARLLVLALPFTSQGVMCGGEEDETSAVYCTLTECQAP